MLRPGNDPEDAPHTLHVRAGGRALSLSFDVTGEVADAAEPVPVPGAAPWCLGLVPSRGRLITLLDAGALFGGLPCRPRYQVVLKGLAVETALAVDEHLGLRPANAEADLQLDRASLRTHPAFQPGAPMGLGPETDA